MRLRKKIGRVVEPIRVAYWRKFHPKIMSRHGFRFIVEPSIVPYYAHRMGRRLLPYFDQYLTSKSVMLDIGASFGFYGMYSGLRAKRAIAFEPNPASYELLKKNIEMNGLNNVETHQCALGDKNGVVDFFVHPSRQGLSGFFTESGQKIEVKSVRLDDFYSGDADFVKIDVEGSELDVLHGMENLIKRCHPTFIIEISRQREEIIAFFRKNDYSVEQIYGSHNYCALHPSRVK